MLLADAGALCAVFDSREPDHAACKRVLKETNRPMITTWPVVTESMHLLGSVAGWRAQEKLWSLIERGALVVAPPTLPQVARARALMDKYRDIPMDLADASLVALAEERGLRRVFTLDGDFEVYRLNGRIAFEVVP